MCQCCYHSYLKTGAVPSFWNKNDHVFKTVKPSFLRNRSELFTPLIHTCLMFPEGSLCQLEHRRTSSSTIQLSEEDCVAIRAFMSESSDLSCSSLALVSVMDGSVVVPPLTWFMPDSCPPPESSLQIFVWHRAAQPLQVHTSDQLLHKNLRGENSSNSRVRNLTVLTIQSLQSPDINGCLLAC